MRLLSAIAVMFFCIQPGHASSIESALKCSKLIRHDTEYSSNGRIRADQIFLCISSNKESISLHYRASAMHRDAYVGIKNSPWLSLKIYDNNKKTIYSRVDFDLADVERCGGYHGHWKAVPITSSEISQIAFYEVSLGGTGPRPCTPQGIDRVIYDAQETVDRWTRGNLTDSERVILSIIGQGGF